MSDAELLIAEAVAYGLPAFEVARLSYDFAYNPANVRRTPVNHFAHRRILSDHRHRLVTTPNHDTLYSSAVLDLTAGPVTLHVPAFGERYHSIAFMDAYTNNFAYIGTRSTGGEGGVYLILGPDWRGEAPRAVPERSAIRSPGHHISLLARILVESASDYAEAHRLQDRLVLSGPQVSRPHLLAPVAGDAENFVAVVNQVLKDDPPPKADAPLLQRLSAVGIGEAALTAEQRTWWRAFFAPARASLAASAREMGPAIDGWRYSGNSVGDFGTDYRTRAIVAIQGFAANIPAESVYSLAMEDGRGRPLDARHRYRFTLPKDAPPADAFWSLSIYEAMPDGGLYFTDNVLHRYALGSTTPDLRRQADGSLELLIQKERPDDIANWLPAPSGPFALMMRAYLPRAEMREGRFHYPGIERLD